MMVSPRAPLGAAALLLLLSLPALAAPRKKAPDDGLPSVDEVAEKARAIYKDLQGNSDPLVRRVVFAGRLGLDDADRAAAVEEGLKESDVEIRLKAITLALSKDKAFKNLAKQAADAVAKLLESGDAEERRQGMLLLDAAYTGKGRQAMLEAAAKNGTPDARQAARQALLALGGKVAWQIIEAGLKAAGEQEYKDAVAALESTTDPVALKWALDKLHDPTMGALARGFLVRFDDPKLASKTIAGLRKTYDKTADFPTRLRIAAVLARRGMVDDVSRTLHAGVKFDGLAERLVAWEGLVASRDTVLLGKLRERIATNESADEAGPAYAWMTAWARANAEPQVIDLLQEVARSDRRELRLRAMAALAEIKHRASAPIFEAAMTEGQVEVRLAAAQGLAAVAKPGDEKRISDYLRKEPSPEVKEALIQAMANIGTADIIDSLQFVITAPQTNLKRKAAEAVAATGSPKAAVLMSLLKRDPDVDVRFLAWHSLLRLKPESLAEFKGGATSWLTPTQVELLGKDPGVHADVLEFIALKGSDEQRPGAVKALTARGPSSATRLLGIFEGSGPNTDTAAAALRGLAELRQAESMATYIAGVRHASGAVRAAGFEAIGRFGTRSMLEQALSGLADKEPSARAAAAHAALQLAGRDA
ncbi:MAG: HEAT repeat domain-containing protein [bacterium]